MRGQLKSAAALLSLWLAGSLATARAQALPGSLGARFVELPIPTRSAGATEIAAGPGGFVWFTETAAGKIGRISKRGIITEFTVPTRRSQPLGITLGPDGNMWFTEFAADKIGRIKPNGEITEFAYPGSGNEAIGISGGQGPNGEEGVWFTSSNGVWFATTHGEFAYSDAPLTVDFCGNKMLAAASGGGDAYFVGSNANTFWRIDRSGAFESLEAAVSYSTTYRRGVVARIHCDPGVAVVGGSPPFPFPLTQTSFPSPDPALSQNDTSPVPIGADFFAVWSNDVPPTLALGPDGRLYAPACCGWIKRLRPSGYGEALKVQSGDPVSQIAAGGAWGDVALFTEHDANRIGVIRENGAVREEVVPTPGSGPYGICEDRFGDVWFVEQDANRIGWVRRL